MRACQFDVKANQPCRFYFLTSSPPQPVKLTTSGVPPGALQITHTTCVSCLASTSGGKEGQLTSSSLLLTS